MLSWVGEVPALLELCLHGSLQLQSPSLAGRGGGGSKVVVSVKAAVSFPSQGFPGVESRALGALLRDAHASQAAGAPPEHELGCRNRAWSIFSSWLMHSVGLV